MNDERESYDPYNVGVTDTDPYLVYENIKEGQNEEYYFNDIQYRQKSSNLVTANDSNEFYQRESDSDELSDDRILMDLR